MTLVCILLNFFIKAVRETRDLHVKQIIFTKTSVMEVAMREHSLRGWVFICTSWTALTMISAWSGTHYIAERTGARTWALVLHILFAIITIPLLIWTIWFLKNARNRCKGKNKSSRCCRRRFVKESKCS